MKLNLLDTLTAAGRETVLTSASGTLPKALRPGNVRQTRQAAGLLITTANWLDPPPHKSLKVTSGKNFGAIFQGSLGHATSCFLGPLTLAIASPQPASAFTVCGGRPTILAEPAVGTGLDASVRAKEAEMTIAMFPHPLDGGPLPPALVRLILAEHIDAAKRLRAHLGESEDAALAASVVRVESPYLTVAEAAAYCRLSVQTIKNNRKYIERKPGTRRWLTTREALDKFLSSRRRRR